MRALISLSDQCLTLSFPAAAAEIVRFLFHPHMTGSDAVRAQAEIRQDPDGTFTLQTPHTPTVSGLTELSLPDHLMDAVIRGLVTDLRSGIALHAAAVAFDDRALLIAGATGVGKSTLTAWLAANHARYLTDELVILSLAGPDTRVSPFVRPLTARHDVLQTLRAQDAFNEERPTLASDGKIMVAPPDDASSAPIAVGAVVLPRFSSALDTPHVVPLEPSQTALALLGSHLNGANLEDGGLAAVSRVARATPAFELHYGDLDQLDDDFLDLVAETVHSPLDGERWHRSRVLFGSARPAPVVPATTPPPRPVHPATPSGRRRLLTIGMATYDDFDGVYFTIQAIRLNNPDLLDDIEFLVVDNNPTGPCADALKDLEKATGNYRYVPYVGQSGTAVRDFVFAEAAGDFVLCLDCHVLLAPNALDRFIDYIGANPDSDDLLQGPMVYDGLKDVSTHFEPVWRSGMYGRWGTDERGLDPAAEPFDIPMQGLGLFACRRAAWPGFNLRFRGFGGEEGYIHEKFRARGARTLCLPFLRWLHRFPRPMGAPYRLNWDDRIRNYVIAFRELGLNEDPVHEHFSELLGAEPEKRIRETVDAELANPFNRFGAMRMINLDERTDRRAAMDTRFAKLGIDRLVNRFPAIATAYNHHVGCALSHRRIVEDARNRSLPNVLVFEDDALLHRRTLDHLPDVLDEISRLEWDILYLGGRLWAEEPTPLPGFAAIAPVDRITCTHGIVYNATVYDRLLRDLPGDEPGMRTWIDDHLAIDQYSAKLDARKFVAVPMLAMQVELFDGQAGLATRSDFDL